MNSTDEGANKWNKKKRKKTSLGKHLPHDLKQMQSLPLEAKIIMTQQRIRQWYEYWDGNVYVSVSGMDSTVLKHIIDSMYDNVPALFVNTGLEYPEIQAFWRDVKNGKYDCFNTDVTIVRPEMRFDEVVKKYGYPIISKEVSKFVKESRSALSKGNTEYYALKKLQGRFIDKNGNRSAFNCEKWEFLLDAPFNISSQCCDVMKKRPAKSFEKSTGRKAFIGTLAEESRLRRSEWIKHGCNAFSKDRPTSQPLSFWTKQDIMRYIKKFNVPYVSVYGDIVPVEGQLTVFEEELTTTGCDRTGCIFCMFGCHLDKEPSRFQRLKETHPRQYEYCIGGGEVVDGKWQPNKEGLGLSRVLDYIGVKYD